MPPTCKSNWPTSSRTKTSAATSSRRQKAKSKRQKYRMNRDTGRPAGNSTRSCGKAVYSGLLPFAFCLLPFALFFAACGKVGAPVPPARFTERTADLSAIQRGGKVMLSWPAPRLVAKETDRSYIARVDIFRLTERRDQEPILDPDEFQDHAQVICSLDRAQIEAMVKQLGRLECT